MYLEQAPNHRQPRTFPSPLLILLAATLLAKVSAKAYSYQSPWIPYKPYVPYYYNQPNNLLSHTLDAYNENTHPQHHYQQIRPPPINQQQIINIHETPSGSEEDYDDTRENNRNIITTIERPTNEIGEESAIVSGEAPQTEANDETQAASNVKYRRQRPDSAYAKNKRTTPRPITKRGSEQSGKIRRYNNKNRVNKRPYTTTYPSYDDYYDYLTTSRIKSRRRTTRRPQRRTTTASYDYDDYQYDNSLDSTHQIITKNGGRRRRRPTRKSNKNRRRPVQETYPDSEYYQANDDSYEDSREYSNYENIQEILPRQQLTSTTESSSSTEFTSTEMTSTTIEPTTTNASVTNNTGYGYGPNYNGNVSLTYGPPNHDYSHPSGYGPSNGNENISITYGPPTGQRLEQVAPLFDAWYNQYARNTVVRRIQDLLHNNQFYNNHDVNYDNAF